MENFKLSFYSVLTDVIDINANDPKRLLYSTRTGREIVVSDSIVQLLLNEQFEMIPDNILFLFLQMEILVPKTEIEFDELINQNELSLKDSKVLSFTVQPSANCQLGCHYCGQQHSKHYMNESIYPLLIERLNNKLTQKEYSALSITWYGGEPLMALKQIRDLSPKFIEISKERGLKYKSDIVTNGLNLNIKTFEELVLSHHVTQYQITIDGLEDSHNKRRGTKGGDDTYQIIMKNVINAAKSEVFSKYNCSISIRCNIDKTNYLDVKPLIIELAKNGLSELVTLQFAPIVDWGQNNASEASLSKDAFSDIEIDWICELHQYGFQKNLLPGRKYGVCMVVNKDSEVVDAFGNLYPCWEVPYTPVYENSNYLIGNLKLPEESYNTNATTRNWHENIKEEGVSWCKKCQFFPVCGGGCPKSWLDGKPACPSFKFNMKDRLLLKYIFSKNKMLENSKI